MEEEKEVGIYEAKNRLSALVEEVARGKRNWITRRGRRVAQLTSGVTFVGSVRWARRTERP